MQYWAMGTYVYLDGKTVRINTLHTYNCCLHLEEAMEIISRWESMQDENMRLISTWVNVGDKEQVMFKTYLDGLGLTVRNGKFNRY